MRARAIRRHLAAVVLLLASRCFAGCAHPRPETIVARPGLYAVEVPDAECVRWLSARRTWSGTSLGAAALSAGTGGLSAAFGADEAARLALGLTGLVAGAVAALAAGVASGYASDFGRHCGEDSNRTP